MSKSTPGPWMVKNTVRQPGDLRSPLGNQCRVDSENAFTGMICVVDDSHENDGQANARLIAAAPDLLEALKKLEMNARNASAFIPHVLLINAIEVAQKAIAKAEGRHE